MSGFFIPTRAKLVSVTASQANSTAAHTTTLGPFTVIGTAQINTSAGLWLIYLDVMFGVPSAAINEDVLLQDILGHTIMTFHTNMGFGATVNPVWIQPKFTMGLLSSGISANQQSWNLVTPATVNGPGYSVNMIGYIV